MATTVFINHQKPDGSSPPPHSQINNADFIPNVGDTLEADGVRYVVTGREFGYAIREDAKHTVQLTVQEK